MWPLLANAAVQPLQHTTNHFIKVNMNEFEYTYILLQIALKTFKAIPLLMFSALFSPPSQLLGQAG